MSVGRGNNIRWKRPKLNKTEKLKTHASLTEPNRQERYERPAANALPFRKPLSKVGVKIMTVDREEKRVENYRSRRNENMRDVKTLKIDQLEKNTYSRLGDECRRDRAI